MLSLSKLLFEDPTQLNLPMAGLSPDPNDSSAPTKWPLYHALSDEFELPEIEFLRLAQEQVNLHPKNTTRVRKVVFTPDRKFYVTTFDNKTRIHKIDNEGMVDRGESPQDFFSDVLMHSDLDSFFDRDLEAEFNADFWSNPQTLYHGTSDIESVLADGIEPRSETRGLNNKHVGDAVFTTSSTDIAESYGSVVKIDTGGMKRDGYMPFVSQEPEFMEYDQIGVIASRLRIEFDSEIADPGIDPSTVIVYGHIPAKYLSVA